MAMFILQALILIAIAFVIGSVAGCWLRSAFTPSETIEAKRELAGAAAQDPVSNEPAGISVLGRPDDGEPAVAGAGSDSDSAPSAPVEKPKPGGGKAGKKSPSRKSVASKAARTKAAPGAKAKRTEKTDRVTSPARDDRTSEVHDDLKKIKGIGRVIEGKLNAAGITSYAQIASWTKKDAAAFSEKLDFQGRIERENWIAQAKVLAKRG